MKKIIVAVIIGIFSVTGCTLNVQRPDYTFTPTSLKNVKRFNMMPKDLHKNYRNRPMTVYSQNGDLVFLRKLLKESTRVYPEGNMPRTVKKARTHIQKVLDKLEGEYNRGKYQYGYMTLAPVLVARFRKELSRNSGKGKYSKRHEFYPKNMPIPTGRQIVEFTPSSVQTLGEFLSNNFEGDGLDFSVALVSMYAIARDIAKWKVKFGHSMFYRKLYFELQRYQIIGLAVQGTWKPQYLNAVITYNQKMTQAKMKPLNPQWFGKKGLTAFVNNGGSMSYIEGKYGNKYASKKRVLWFFNPMNSRYRGKY